jgi:hypothetical protein
MPVALDVRASSGLPAPRAAVIVISHADFHSGRLHLPVHDGHGVTDRMTLEELVFRRSHLVNIDQIDAFQNDVISQAARSLVLDRHGSTHTPSTAKSSPPAAAPKQRPA